MKPTPKIWDIWLASVKFEKSDEIKQRPVLLYKEKENVVGYISIKITSHALRPEFEGEYQVKYWKEAGLDRSPVIRCSKIIELSEKDLIYKLGTLHIADIQKVRAKVSHPTL